MTLFHRKLRQQKLTPASGLVSDAWTGLLWSMKGKHLRSISHNLLTSKICYVFSCRQAQLDHLKGKSCCDYETVKQSKKQKKKEKNKQQRQDATESSHCDCGKDESQWHLGTSLSVGESNFTKSMPLVSVFLLLVLVYFAQKIICITGLPSQNKSRAATFLAVAGISAWRKIRKAFSGLAKFADGLFQLDKFFYSGWSSLVKFTKTSNVYRDCVRQKACFTLICEKFKL